jgi:hypothetical protein
VLDVLLQSDSDAMLPRLGLAVMEALSSHLLELNDFEEVITYLKVGGWGVRTGVALSSQLSALFARLCCCW